MLKNTFLYVIFCLIFIAFIFTILFGALLRHHYLGGERFPNLQKFAVFIAEVPKNTKFIIKHRDILGQKLTPIIETADYNKKFFDKKLKNSLKEELILISRHDGDLGRSIVEIRDLNNFEVLHSYIPDIKKIYEKFDLSKKEFKQLKDDLGINKFYMMNPEITLEGDLIFQSSSPLVKIDLLGNIIWVNNDYIYHHSNNLDENGNIYVPSHKNPFSDKVSKFVGKKEDVENNFLDDAISIVNQNGELIFIKSVSEILIENGYLNRVFSQETFKSDPIHLNDIEVVQKDTPYFKKGDLFLSLRNLSMVILYRPSTNKIIKIIEGNFFNHHDVDILDEQRISIYNNNVFLNYKNERVVKNNEIIIYNFANNSFSKKFEDFFIENNINSSTKGLIDFLPDGSAIIEDSNNGRIFYINNRGQIIWKFNNLDSKNQVYDLWWARIINKEKSIKIKKILESIK